MVKCSVPTQECSECKETNTRLVNMGKQVFMGDKMIENSFCPGCLERALMLIYPNVVITYNGNESPAADSKGQWGWQGGTSE